ncbi:restriction endonuclease subunit S [Corynebacterium sp. LK31]|uniref:restriction endonuclease subunit S n=1 Tax=Corynebacterium sp. LK31 TaxID=2044576 RepID=UPI0018D75CE1|nr:restriction endonuclease subunit S [Corynebacterium sp. LK31]
MNQIEKLIEELCPDGVTHLPLEDFLTIRNGKDHKHLEDGEIPVYGSGGIMRHVNQAAASGPSVLIPRKGSLGNLFYVEGPFWVVDTIFRTEINEDIALPKFVFYELQTLGLGEMNQAGGVPSQTQSKLKKLRIPIPPLPIQQEIVKILDTFQSLEAELEAELEARKKQYEFYRNQLLTFTERERESSGQR